MTSFVLTFYVSQVAKSYHMLLRLNACLPLSEKASDNSGLNRQEAGRLCRGMEGGKDMKWKGVCASEG